MKKHKGIRHQRNRAQKEAKRNAVVAAKKKEQAAASLSLIYQARAAASAFGVSYCMVTKGIFDIGIGYVILGRTISPTKVATGVFLVDVCCLGIKNAYYAERTHEQLSEMIDKLTGDNPIVDIAPECARKIVDGAIAYAKEFGFIPMPTIRQPGLCSETLMPESAEPSMNSARTASRCTFPAPTIRPQRSGR